MSDEQHPPPATEEDTDADPKPKRPLAQWVSFVVVGVALVLALAPLAGLPETSYPKFRLLLVVAVLLFGGKEAIVAIARSRGGGGSGGGK